MSENKIVRINNTEFDMYSYYITSEGVSVRIKNSTFPDISNAASDEATVRIGTEYTGQYLKLITLSKIENDIEAYFVNNQLEVQVNIINGRVQELQSSVAAIDPQVKTNTGDIELNAEAIVELAAIIGGEVNG